VSTGIVHLRPLAVAYVRRIGPYSRTVGEAWDHLLAWVDRRGARGLITRGFGLIRDNSRLVAPEKLRYDACVELVEGLDEDIPGGVGVQLLPSGAFMRQRHRGGYGGIGPAISRLATEEATRRNLAVDTGRPLIAIYLDDPAKTPEARLRTEICLPVTARQRRAADADAA
jgi:AraC family transcriptional regulator